MRVPGITAGSKESPAMMKYKQRKFFFFRRGVEIFPKCHHVISDDNKERVQIWIINTFEFDDLVGGSGPHQPSIAEGGWVCTLTSSHVSQDLGVGCLRMRAHSQCRSRDMAPKCIHWRHYVFLFSFLFKSHFNTEHNCSKYCFYWSRSHHPIFPTKGVITLY